MGSLQIFDGMREQGAPGRSVNVSFFCYHYVLKSPKLLGMALVHKPNEGIAIEAALLALYSMPLAFRGCTESQKTDATRKYRVRTAGL